MAERKPAPRGRRRGATLRDVAAAAGVSVWTVSTTYSNPAKVAEATRQRVYDAADELGYAGPHPGARSLARGRTGIVAFVAPGDAEALLADPAAGLVARGLLTACDRAGYSLLLSGLASGENVDGRVFFRRTTLADARVPAIVVDGDGGSGVHVVRADVRGAARDMAAHLYGLGHRHLTVLAWPGADDRLAGVREGWGGADPLEVLTLGEGRTRAALGEALARAALARTPRPTALLALSDALAASALTVAHWMGLDVPRDVSVAGLDDLPDSAALGLTTALIPYRPLGERAGDVLTTALAGGGDEVPAYPDLPTALSIRRTTGPPPGAKRTRPRRD
jgi:DNA-binding LacI/PurR family transcriptional regulator